MDDASSAPAPDVGRTRVRRSRRTPSPAPRLRQRAIPVIAVLGMVAGLVGLMTLPGAVRAVTEARRARTIADRGTASLNAGNVAEARAAFRDASAHFATADRSLSSVLTLPARLIPIVGRQLRTARSLARAGTLLTSAGADLADAVGDRAGGAFSLHDGKIDLDELRRAAGPLGRAAPAARAARRELEASSGSLLVGPLQTLRAESLKTAVAADDALTKATAAIGVVPDLLGGTGARRFFVAFSNLAELRGTGGLIGHYAVIESSAGKVALTGRGKPIDELPSLRAASQGLPDWARRSYNRYGADDIWLNVNMSSDFPTVAAQMARAAGPAVGQVDGVIQIDPLGLRPLLDLTGPVTVAGWPDPVTSANVSSVTQNEAYVRFGNDVKARVDFLGRVIDAVFSRALAGELRLTPGALRALGDAAAGGNIQLFSTRAPEQRVFEELGVARSVRRADGATDVLGVIGENGAGNKVDWFLRRKLSYDVRLDPEAGISVSRLSVTLGNTAPAEGLPDYVIGNLVPPLPRGGNRQVMILLRPPSDVVFGVQAAGQPLSISRDLEDDLRAYHTATNILPGAETRMIGDFAVIDGVRGSGSERVYTLHVLQQPVATPDDLQVTIQLPQGWSTSAPLTFDGPLTRDLVMTVRLHHVLRASLFDTLVLRPARVARRLVGLEA